MAKKNQNWHRSNQKGRVVEQRKPIESPRSNMFCFYTTEVIHMELGTDQLESGQAYQRPVRQARVTEIIDSWNPLFLDEIIVSARDGKYYVVDGQNRIAAMKKMNNDDHCLVRCKVFRNLTYQMEADMFYHLDSVRGNLRFNEQTNALIEAQTDADVNAAYDILRRYGIRWDTTGKAASKDFTVTCSKAIIEQGVKAYGAYDFESGIRLLLNTWRGAKAAFTAPFIKGICLFCHTYHREYDEDVFVQKLGDCTPGEIKALAQQQYAAYTQAEKYARVFLAKYNFRASAKRLPDRFA